MAVSSFDDNERFNQDERKETAMASFSIALTGLEADTVALNTIGNNLSNLNTTAFKGQSTSFEDLFYQQIGASGSNASRLFFQRCEPSGGIGGKAHDVHQRSSGMIATGANGLVTSFAMSQEIVPLRAR